MRTITFVFAALALFAASPAFGASQHHASRTTLPKQVLITGVPFVSWQEAAKMNYPDKNILNPSIAAVQLMMMEYWGGKDAVAAMDSPRRYVTSKGWETKHGKGLTLKELKAYLARGIPVELALPLTPYAHPLDRTALAMIKAGVLKGVKLDAPGHHSGILGRMVPLAKFVEISPKAKFNFIHESTIAAYALAIGYDDTRHVFILHNPSFGPAFELSDAQFKEMWQAAEDRYFTEYPKDLKPAAADNAPYRARTLGERAAQDYAYGYALASIGRLTEAETQYRHGLAIPGLDKGHRALLDIDLAMTLIGEKRIDDAIAAARDATQALPDDAGAWRLLQRLYGASKAPDAKLKAQMAATHASSRESLAGQKALAKALPCDYLLLNVAQTRGWCGK